MNSLANYLSGLEVEESFYGRVEERKQLNELLDSDSSLIVVRGDPGIGKSALTSKVLLERSGAYRIVDVEVEGGDNLHPLRIFAHIVNRALSNPSNDSEVEKKLREWYGEKYNSSEPGQQLLKSFLWSHYPFEGFAGGGSFSGEDTQRLLTNSLGNFFSSYEGGIPLVVRLQNYERRLLGESKLADELIRDISSRVDGKKASFVVETRDVLDMGQEEIRLGALKEFPLRDYVKKISGVNLTPRQVEEIRKLSSSHPYIMELWPFFFQDVLSQKRKPSSLEDFLDTAIESVDSGDRKVLELISLPQRPYPAKQVEEGAEILEISPRALKGRIKRLVNSHLCLSVIYDGEFCVAPKNPRLGERVIELLNDKKSLHRVLYRTSRSDKDKLTHSLEGKMPGRAYDSLMSLIGRLTPGESIDLLDRGIELLRGNSQMREKFAELVFMKARSKVFLNEYDLNESINILELTIPDIPNNVLSQYYRDYLSYIQHSSLGDFSKAREWLLRAKDRAKEIEVDNLGYLERVLYSEQLIDIYKSRLDPSLSDSERKFILCGLSRRIKDITDKSVWSEHWENLYSCILTDLSKYEEDPNVKKELLDTAEQKALKSISLTPRSFTLNNHLVTLAEVYLAKGEYDKTKAKLEECDEIAFQYGEGKKDRVDHLIAKFRIAQKTNDKKLEEEYRKKIETLLESTNPRDFFGYSFLLKE